MKTKKQILDNIAHAESIAYRLNEKKRAKKHKKHKTYLTDKYLLEIKKYHALLITELDTDYPKFHLFSLPIKHVLHRSTKLLKILFRHNLITQKQVILSYNQWVAEESEIILEKTDHRNLLKEYITIPVRRRGNEHYHKYTWSKLQWYQMVFDSIPTVLQPTNKKKPRFTLKEKKIINSKVIYLNTFLVTLTYPYTPNTGDAWNDISPDLNRYFTNLKGRLKRRDNPLYFYIRALESQNNGMPHIHILLKLPNPIPCYSYPTRQGTKYKPFNKKLFHWKYGHYDIMGVKEHKNSVSYITKYITKTTNKDRTAKQNKSLALSWMSNKRLYSNSMLCLFKTKFPNLHKFISKIKYFDNEMNIKKICDKFTINKAVDELWNGLKLPCPPWSIRPGLRSATRFPIRELMRRNSFAYIKEPLQTRLNYEGFYQVAGIRLQKPNSSCVFRPIEKVSKRKIEEIKQKNFLINQRLKKIHHQSKIKY